MNLVEVVVATSLFLGACSGAAQMGAASAQAMNQARQQGQLQEQIEAQFLAAGALVHQLEPASEHSCAAAAQQLQSALAAALPPVPVGLQRQLSLAPAGDQVQLTLAGAGGLQRQRSYSPAAAGLCAADRSLGLEASDAAL